jgi:hypothetical protein
MPVNFYTITNDKRPSPHNKHPASQGHNQILQGNGNTGRQQPQIRNQRANAFQPDPPHQQNAQHYRSVLNRFAPVVQGPRIVGETSMNKPQRHPAHKPQQKENEQRKKQIALKAVA